MKRIMVLSLAGLLGLIVAATPAQGQNRGRECPSPDCPNYPDCPRNQVRERGQGRNQERRNSQERKQSRQRDGSCASTTRPIDQ